ncbi:hypothetical protein Q4528_13345, partial [Staphylococcus pasteuri_A]|nr:hypothetical protein [Staphylococcus pasteuri_A]
TQQLNQALMRIEATKKPKSLSDIVSGEKARLSFSVVNLSDGKLDKASGEPFFTVQTNPQTFKKKLGINYKNNKTIGRIGTESEYEGFNPENVDFSFVLD